MTSSGLPIFIKHVLISPGHNFFGHHGREPGHHAMVEVERVECVEGRGLRGDRFFDYKPDYKGQATFFAWETYLDLCHALGLHDTPPSACRRNIITEGIDLNSLVATTFEIQGVRFIGDSECRPCFWMDRAFASGAETHLKGFGGLRARILTSGVLAPGRCELRMVRSNREGA